MIAEQKARQRYGVNCSIPGDEDDDHEPEADDLCTAVSDQRPLSSR